MTIISKIIKGFNTSENYETCKKIFNGCKYILFALMAGVLLYFIKNILTIFGHIIKTNSRLKFGKNDSDIDIGFVAVVVLFAICIVESVHGVMYIYFIASNSIETNDKCETNKKIIVLDTKELYSGLVEEGKGKKYLHYYVSYTDLYRIIFSYIINTFLIAHELYHARLMSSIAFITVGNIIIDMCVLLILIIYRVFYDVVIKSQ